MKVNVYNVEWGEGGRRGIIMLIRFAINASLKTYFANIFLSSLHLDSARILMSL